MSMRPRRVKLVVLRPQVVQVAPLLGRGLLREDDMGPTSILLRCRMLCAIRKWPGQCRGRHVHRLVFCVTKYVSQALSAPSTTSRLPSALRTTQPPAGDLSRPLSLARSHLLPRHICRRRSSVCSDGFCGRRRGAHVHWQCSAASRTHNHECSGRRRGGSRLHARHGLTHRREIDGIAVLVFVVYQYRSACSLLASAHAHMQQGI